MTDEKSDTGYINKIITYYYPSTQIARFNTVKNFCLSSLRPRSFNFSMDFATSLKDYFHFKFSCQAELTTGKNKNKVDDKDNSASRMQKIFNLEKDVHSLKHLLWSKENNK